MKSFNLSTSSTLTVNGPFDVSSSISSPATADRSRIRSGDTNLYSVDFSHKTYRSLTLSSKTLSIIATIPYISTTVANDSDDLRREALLPPLLFPVNLNPWPQLGVPCGSGKLLT